MTTAQHIPAEDRYAGPVRWNRGALPFKGLYSVVFRESRYEEDGEVTVEHVVSLIKYGHVVDYCPVLDGEGTLEERARSVATDLFVANKDVPPEMEFINPVMAASLDVPFPQKSALPM